MEEADAAVQAEVCLVEALRAKLYVRVFVLVECQVIFRCCCWSVKFYHRGFFFCRRWNGYCCCGSWWWQFNRSLRFTHDKCARARVFNWKDYNSNSSNADCRFLPVTCTTVESNVAIEIQHKNRVLNIVDINCGVVMIRLCWSEFDLKLTSWPHINHHQRNEHFKKSLIDYWSIVTLIVLNLSG